MSSSSSCCSEQQQEPSKASSSDASLLISLSGDMSSVVKDHCAVSVTTVSAYESVCVTPLTVAYRDKEYRVIAACRRTLKLLPLLAPFLLLSFAYALYFVIMLLYNDRCKINMWGYNAFDQVSFPVYMFAVFFIVDFIAPCRQHIRWDDQQEDSVVQAVVVTFRELTANRCAGLWHMFIYRLLINTRAVAYTYITVQYNLSSSYLELTLIRVVLSWIASLLLVLFVPRFIRSEPLEQLKLRDWVNLSLKCLGTCAIVGSLLVIHYQ
jgi:hypothetical protein